MKNLLIVLWGFPRIWISGSFLATFKSLSLALAFDNLIIKCIGVRLLLLSHFSRVWLCVTPEMAAHQAPHSWDSPGKNTGVGCHCLLQCMKVKSESEVTQSCPTPSNPMDCSPPGSSTHGIFQARVLEWVSIAFSRRSQFQNLHQKVCLVVWRVLACNDS